METMNYDALIFVFCADAIQYLMACFIFGRFKLSISELTLYVNPLFFPVTLFFFIKKILKREE